MENNASGALLIIVFLTANAILIIESTQNRMNELNDQFNEVMTQTISFLDHAWEIAQKFKDPNYNYDQSELQNYTLPQELDLRPTE
ncbi:MAG: hypothetical protein RMK50_00470 [Nitrososphaerota archaeon]|nr:hypothetical protein [Candidatus Bathyarchaeota archaeon]MDW8193290.1 hypothetical protein [Nitrososphaerota archaeon]